MDLNRLYFDHQLLMMQAHGAMSSQQPNDHAVQAAQIADEIASFQRTLGASAAPIWEALATPGSGAKTLQLNVSQGSSR